MGETRWLEAAQLRAWVRTVAVLELLPGALDSQLQRDAELTHYEYFVLAMLSEAPERTLRMSELARATNATAARLSHVVSRLEGREFVTRVPDTADRRVTRAHLTETGWRKIVASAPGHVENVRRLVIDPLDARDVADLERIMGKLRAGLDPERAFGSRVPGDDASDLTETDGATA